MPSPQVVRCGKKKIAVFFILLALAIVGFFDIAIY